jgi:hypothetical protein
MLAPIEKQQDFELVVMLGRQARNERDLSRNGRYSRMQPASAEGRVTIPGDLSRVEIT